MERSIAVKLSLEDLAQSVNLSKFHFARSYKQLTGESLMAHFMNIKLKRARYLLDLETRSVADAGLSRSVPFSHVHFGK